MSLARLCIKCEYFGVIANQRFSRIRRGEMGLIFNRKRFCLFFFFEETFCAGKTIVEREEITIKKIGNTTPVKWYYLYRKYCYKK